MTDPELPPSLPIPGFDELPWLFVMPPAIYEDEETGEFVTPEPYYIKRYVRFDAFPGAPDGKTAATDAIALRLGDLERNPSPEAIAGLVGIMRDLCEASLRALFEDKGVPFFEGEGHD